MLAGLLFNTLEKQLLPAVSLEPGRCLRSRLGKNPCARCLTRCVHKALTADGGTISFHDDRCTECMICISTCPNDALRCGFDLQGLLRVLHENRDGEPVVLSCGRSPSYVPGRLAIPCIGLFSEPVLAAMNVVAARAFYLDIHACHDCDNGHALGLLQERMSGILGRNDRKAELRLRCITDATSRPASHRQARRSFLGVIKKNMADLGRPAAPLENAATEERCSAKEASAGPLLLRQALAMLPLDDDPARRLLHSYFHTLTANDDCDLCPRCTGMCPTGALKRLRNDAGKKQLSFSSAKCSGCGLCVAFCNKKALTLRAGVLHFPETAMVIA